MMCVAPRRKGRESQGDDVGAEVAQLGQGSKGRQGRAAGKGRENRRNHKVGGRDVTPSFHFIFQKLLNDKKVLEKDAGRSEAERQDSQEPRREGEYRKLQDTLKQRDSEISILSGAVGGEPCLLPGGGGRTGQVSSSSATRARAPPGPFL